jgi:hypothetical protein
MTSHIHDSVVSSFCWHFSVQIRSWITKIAPEYEVRLRVSPLLELEDVPIRRKAPDAALDIVRRGTRTRWPQMVLEVGYSESTDQLRRDAMHWLLGTRGVVRSVMIIKLDGPRGINFDKWQKWSGWIEIWVPSPMAR